MASQRSIEVKVGIFILTALGLLAAFILVMGGINFQPTYNLYVDFDNPGGVQTGAPVRIAGVKVGKVEAVEFRGGHVDDKTGRREPLVRLKVSLEKRYQKAIYENSLFYVTTQGVLGEQFLAIEPGSSDRPVLPENATVRGLDPPRLDMLLAESYELLHSTVSAVRDHRAEIGDAFDSLRTTLHGTGTFFANNGDKIDRIVTNVEQASVDGDDLIKGANEKFVKNPKVDRIMDNVDAVSQELAANTPGLVDDAKVTMKNARKISDTLGSDEQQAKIKHALDDTVTLLDKANGAATDAQSLITHIKQGRGTVGALLMDEQLFDDLQEMVRDLKHNPWKFFWRE
jgi:phospholipid/cholesterol/gamma-HCH transport system substrate-binding protein